METSLLPLAVFALVTSITPGPNNVMIATSAANHGLRATLPHIMGVSLGFALMLVIVGLGLATPLASYPEVLNVLHWIGAAWLFWLAIQIARAPPPDAASTRAARRPPLGFLGGAAFQWVNPKAWLLALSAASAWLSPTEALLPQVLTIGAVFLVVCIPSTLFWGALGRGTGWLLRHPWHVRVFNWTMAALLVASLVPILMGKE
ncbi:MAG: LysE family translocator [Rhodospirillales bacterium]|nr:LysE family translocator [Rhodospirillales bacterium]